MAVVWQLGGRSGGRRADTGEGQIQEKGGGEAGGVGGWLTAAPPGSNTTQANGFCPRGSGFGGGVGGGGFRQTPASGNSTSQGNVCAGQQKWSQLGHWKMTMRGQEGGQLNQQ